MLKDLENPDKTIHLICTYSEQAKVYLINRMKEIMGIGSDEYRVIRSQEDLKSSWAELSVPPLFTSEWLCRLDIPKGHVYEYENKLKELRQTYGVYLIFVNSYSDYKRLKGVLPEDITNCLYLNKLNRSDIGYILGQTVVNLSEVAYKKICKDYIRNIDAIFELKSILESGEKVNTRNELLQLIGPPDPDVTSWGISIAKWVEESTEKTDASKARSLRNMLNKIIPLAHDKSPEYVRVCLKNVWADIIHEKQKALTGEYMEPTYKKIENIQVDICAELYTKANNTGKWQTIDDCILFMYDIYIGR